MEPRVDLDGSRVKIVITAELNTPEILI